MKITSRLVSGAVALAMAGAVPAWAESATHGIQAPVGGHSAAAARRARKSAPLRLASAAADPAAAQGSTDQQQPALQEIVVTGIRQSMEGALNIKRFSDTIVDAIVASQIGKLPDVTAIDALQRIPGIQVSRQLGEGGGTVNIGGSVINSGYEIRGLPYAETTLNGREVFSATGARTLNLEDIPSSMLAGIEVYKDPTASLIAGGLAGTVNLRTHRPFDFSRPQLDLSAGETYGDLIGTAKPNFNVLGSDTWHTGIGKVGALLDFSYHERAYREDGATNNSIATNKTAVPGQTIQYTNGVYNTMFVGDRHRIGFDGVLQWQPTDDLQTYAEVSSEDFTWAQHQYTFYSNQGGGTILPGSVSLFPGTNDVSSMTITNAMASTVGAWRTVEDVNRQYNLHARWSPGQWIVAGDLSYTSATERLNNPAVDIGTTIPTLTQSTSASGITTSSVPGFDLTNIANFNDSTASNYHSYYYDTEQHFRGGETAATLDVTYDLQHGFLTSVQSGLRFADRKDAFNQWSTFGAITSAAIQANAASFNNVPLSPFFSAISSGPVIPAYTVFNPGQLHFDQGGVQQAFGIKPPVDNGSQDYHVDERTYAGYVQLNFAGNVGLPMTGNVGVRLVHHTDRMTGELASGGVYSPAVFSHGEVDPLPSLNLTFKLLRDLQWRIAASKVIAYPDFSQIRPSISLLPAQGAASGGNPSLKPTTATQFDTSLEYYFQPGAALTADVFYKSIHDFWLSETQQNAFTIGGVNYNLTGAVDGGNATIKGAEFGYQQFFRNLPGLLSGLGVAANYTYIKAAAPTAVAGVSTTLPGLSNNSYNLIGIYEKGPVSFRVAYNWRSAFYSSLYTGSTAQLAANPIYTKAYGWLDASLEYTVTHNVQVYVDGSNLLRTKLITYYGVPTLPQGATIDDREVMAGVNVKF
jgi:iron complex outermembrane receptor protein